MKTNDVWRSVLMVAVKYRNGGMPVQIFYNGTFPTIVAPNNVTPTSNGARELYGLTGTELICVIEDYVKVPHSYTEESKSLKEKRDDQKEELLKFVNKRPRRIK